MRSLLIACSLLFGAHAFAGTKNIEITEEKGVERHSYYFGMVRVNTMNSVTYTVTNTGSTPLTFHSATISGIGYSAVHNCTRGLQPQARCQFRIEYFPFMEGHHFGEFYLAFDPESDISVRVSANATR